IPAKIDIQENAFHTVAAFVIDRTEWDIRFNSGKFFKDLGDKMINDAIEFELTLIAKS
ncbi:MAG: YceI family protein, partial [Flavobacteriales bacterium]|nr:YceI family protein [Flavobacteriales bacterium]